MRGSLLVSLALAGSALLFSVGAEAVPIHVGLKNAAGNTNWTSPVIGDPHGTVTLSGWEYDSNGPGTSAWAPATMTYKSDSPAETGMGVACNQFPAHNACGQKEIGATPWQMIDINISALTGWSSLTINLGSVNGIGYPDGDETGYLLGATCTVGGSCTPTVLATCADFGTGHSATCSFNLTYADLLGITDIWVTPSITNPDGADNANILLGADFVLYTVPEPATLGIFGLGLLLIGAFVGLRRRRTF